MIQHGLVAYLQSLNTEAGTRIYPAGKVRTRPQLPYITWSFISGDSAEGTATTAAFSNDRFQLTCIASDPDDAAELADVLWNKLNRQASPTSPLTMGDYSVQHIFVERLGDLPSITHPGSEQGIFGRVLEVELLWGKPAPTG